MMMMLLLLSLPLLLPLPPLQLAAAARACFKFVSPPLPRLLTAAALLLLLLSPHFLYHRYPEALCLPLLRPIMQLILSSPASCS